MGVPITSLPNAWQARFARPHGEQTRHFHIANCGAAVKVKMSTDAAQCAVT